LWRFVFKIVEEDFVSGQKEEARVHLTELKVPKNDDCTHQQKNVTLQPL